MILVASILNFSAERVMQSEIILSLISQLKQGCCQRMDSKKLESLTRPLEPKLSVVYGYTIEIGVIRSYISLKRALGILIKPHG